MNGFHGPIEQLSLENSDFRRVLYTANNVQLVLMSLRPNEEIGSEVHEDSDQFFRVEAGEGKVFINGKEKTIKDGDVVIVPQGAEHNVLNTSTSELLKLYTLYCPPHHKDGTIHATKANAESDHEHFDGKITEE